MDISEIFTNIEVMNIIIKYLFILFILLCSALTSSAGLKEITININTKSKYIKDFTVEVRRFYLNTYFQNFSDLGIAEKIDVHENNSFNAFVENDKIYYINIKPYNFSEIFYPQNLDSLTCELFIDSNGIGVLKLKFEDSLNLINRKFNIWIDKISQTLESLKISEFLKYKKSLASKLIDSDEKVGFLKNNFIDSNTFYYIYYLKLLQYIQKNVKNLDSTILSEEIMAIESFIEDTNITDYNRKYHLSIIDYLTTIKINLFGTKKQSHLELFRDKNKLLGQYPINILPLLYYKHFIYFVAMYYDLDRNEKLGDIDSLINILNGKKGIDKDVLNSLSSIFDTTKINKRVFDYTILIDPSGNRIQDFIFQNKVVLINFWTSWCPHCKDIMEFSKILLEKFKKEDFTVINISLDGKLSNWINNIQNYPIGNHFISIGSDGNKYSKEFFINEVPRCFLVDKKGNIVNNNLTIPFNIDLTKNIDNLLKSKR